MKNIVAIAALFLMISCAQSPQSPSTAKPESTCDPDVLTTGHKGLPADATDVADRMAACMHFWGEVGDNDPERTAQLDKAFEELRCDKVESEVAVMKKKYAANLPVTKALTCAAGE